LSLPCFLILSLCFPNCLPGHLAIVKYYWNVSLLEV
ncbi:hypothetical protein Csa_023804, partial [Cucumis sativus]